MRFYKSVFHTRKNTSVLKITQVFIRITGHFFSDIDHISSLRNRATFCFKLISGVYIVMNRSEMSNALGL